MKLRMEAVEVSVERDYVLVSQDNDTGDKPATVYLHANQIDAVCDWLQRAKVEALKAVEK